MIAELERAGLTGSEIKVYLALLEIKDATRAKIVHASQITGSKIYDLLGRLQKKGLVSVYKQNNVQHFKAINPKQILSYLDDKQEEIERAKQTVDGVMPKLLSLFHAKEEEQEVELLTGLKGLHILFTEQIDLLNKGDSCYMIGGTQGSDEEAVHAFFEKVHVWREDKGIYSKMLFNSSQKESTLEHYSQEKFPFTETRFIDHTSPVAINIYADVVSIIIFGKTISIIKISSRDVAESFLEYFTLLWMSSQ